MTFQDDRRDALNKGDGEYRYWLSRTWDGDGNTLGWIMLNPSTADAVEDDPTIRRCIGYAKAWGYGTILVGNLFALRATDPAELRDHPDPLGPENGEHLAWVVDMSDRVVVAWGGHGDLLDRGREVAAQIDADLFALDTTKDGQPVHPLYQPKDAEPEPFSYGGDSGE